MLRLIITLFFCSILASTASAEEPDKWEGYIEFTGKPGTSRSLGQSDLLVPLWQDQNDMSFFNLRGMTENFNDGDFSIGFGHRHQFNNFILGGYGYFDGSESDEGIYYHQWSTGIEVLGDKWDFRANGYIADNDTKEAQAYVLDKADVVIDNNDDVWVDYSRFDYLRQEKSSSGFDVEVGYKLPVLEDTRIYAGMYHFFGEQGFEDVTGPKARIETRLYDLSFMGPGSRLMAGMEYKSDDVRGGQATGLISLRIPFGIESNKPMGVLKELDRRMMEPVVKNTSIITTQKETTRFQSGRNHALNPENKVYTTVMYADSSESMEEIMVRAQVLIDDKELPMVLIKEDSSGKALDLSGEPIIGDATFALAGQFLKVDYFNRIYNTPKTTSFIPEGNTPTLNLLAEKKINKNNAALYFKDRSHINGFDIDARDFVNGGVITEEGKYYITNSTFQNAAIDTSAGPEKEKGNGLFIAPVDWNDPKDIEVHIEDSEFSNNASSGIGANFGPKIVVRNSIFDSNGGNGVRLDSWRDLGTKVEIYDSTLSNNGSNGLVAYFGAKVFADNLKIHNNGAHGVFSIGASENKKSSYIEIKNSEIWENEVTGLLAYQGGWIIADQVWLHHNTHGANSKYFSFANGNKSYLEISNSIIHDNASIGLAAAYDGDIKADNVAIYNNTVGVKVQSRGSANEDWESVATISNSAIFNNTEDGVVGHWGAKLYFDNVLIEGNGESGIWMSGETEIALPSLDIKNSTIRNNGNYGIVFYGHGNTVIKDSAIYGNGLDGLYAFALNGAIDIHERDEDGEYVYVDGDKVLNPGRFMGPHEKNKISLDNVDIYGNGTYGIKSLGSQITVTNSRVYDNGSGPYFNQTGLYDNGNSFNAYCLRGDGFIKVDGEEIPGTELWPILNTYQCNAD